MAMGNAVGVASDVPEPKFQTVSWPFVGEMRGTTPFTGDAPATYAIIGPLVPVPHWPVNICDAYTIVADTFTIGFELDESIGVNVLIVPFHTSVSSEVASSLTPSQHVSDRGQAGTFIVAVA
jgi:hypothetical protein